MKKVFLVSVVAIFLSINAFAQSPVHFGLKGGAYYADFSPDFDNPALGYLGGVFVRFDLPKKIILQPEVYYSLKRSENLLSNDFTDKGDVDIALLGGYRFVDNKLFKFRLMAGVVNSINVTDNLPAGSEGFESNSLGYSAGLGIDITKLTFDVRYESSFGDVAPGLKFSGFQAALGFKFL